VFAITESFIPGATPKVRGTLAGMRRFAAVAATVFAPDIVQAIEQTASAETTMYRVAGLNAAEGALLSVMSTV
jgi:hypothetical protein